MKPSLGKISLEQGLDLIRSARERNTKKAQSKKSQHSAPAEHQNSGKQASTEAR